MVSPQYIAARIPSIANITSLSSETLHRVNEAWLQLTALPRINPPAPGVADQPALQMALDDQMRRKLRHPLSAQAMARAGPPLTQDERKKAFAAIAARTQRENSVLKLHCSAFHAAIEEAGSAALVAVLERMASDLLGEPTALRNTSAVILPDAESVGWHCIESHEIAPRLIELHRFIASASREAPLLTAIVALVMLSGVHPLMDGNGRMSRVVFHAILHRAIQLSRPAHADAPDWYLPLRAFYFLSDFGFEIRLRLTFMESNWEPITRYFCNVICACNAMQTMNGGIGAVLEKTDKP
jgi:Fic/DOC family